MEVMRASSSRRKLPRALIVSEVMLFREGLRAGLARIGSLEVVAAAAPGEAHAIIRRQGLSNKQIAQELRISPATVKNHVHNILEKSNLPSRSAIGGRLEQSQFSASG